VFRTTRIGVFLLFLLALLVGTVSVVIAADQDFTMVLFPDTQFMVKYQPDVWFSMCQWVVDNKMPQNIQAVLSLGDITDGATEKEFIRASDGFALLEKAGIPFAPIIASHDYDSAQMYGRKDTQFNKYFGPNRFTDKPWYGSNLEGSDANYYLELTVGSTRFIILALEFYPRKKAMLWASGIIDANSDAEVILLTHGYLNPDGTRTKADDRYGPSFFALSGEENTNSGEDLWNNLVKKKQNVLAVICGHQPDPPHTAHRSDTGDNGNIIHQIFADYQSAANFGDGWIGVLTFHPSVGTVDVSYFRTYAPSGLGYDSDSPKYTLKWPQLLKTTP
jgi:hypothetical protein